MAGEVKYDSLPFIDSSGKDFFEVGGEDDIIDSHDNFELRSESVDHIALNQKESFNVFKDKYLDPSHIDFSDKITSSNRPGYESKSVYEIIAEQVSVETPQQKYQRLQTELKELADEVQLIKQSEEKADSAVSLAQEVQYLQKQLHDLHLEKIFGPEVIASDGFQPGTWRKQIVDQLECFNQKHPQTKDSSGKDVVYQMYYHPEHSKYSQTAKISELESKLKDIENFVGSDTKSLKNLVSEPGSLSTLMDIAESMHAKLSLFDVSHIDVITARLQGVVHCINEISQKKSAIEDVDTKEKVEELHKLITSWESVADIVPDLVERLKALSSLNEQAATFCQSMEHLMNTQAEVRQQLRSQKETLNNFEASFATNTTAIQNNCEALDKRIANLAKKVCT